MATIIILKLWSGHRDPNQQPGLSGSAQWECLRGYLCQVCWIFNSQHSFMNPVSFNGKFLISSKYYSGFGGNEEDFSANFQVNEDLYFPPVQCPRCPLCQQQSANWVRMITRHGTHLACSHRWWCWQTFLTQHSTSSVAFILRAHCAWSPPPATVVTVTGESVQCSGTLERLSIE